MKRNPVWVVALLCTLVLLAPDRFLRGAQKPDVTCGWRDRDVKIDGDSTEWEGTFVAIEKPSLVMGMMNDQDYLYVCLIPQSRDVRAQMLHLGFTLWFDPAGGQEKVFGIRFPVGSGWRPSPGGPPAQGAASDQERFQQFVDAANSELEILVPRTGERHRIPVRTAQGIEVKIGAVETRFVYEARIPLARDEHQIYAIGANPGQLIGIQMETPEIAKDRGQSEHRGGEAEGGGWEGHHGGGGPGEGGPGGFGDDGPMGGGGRGSPPKPLKLSLRVQLATKAPTPAS